MNKIILKILIKNIFIFISRKMIRKRWSQSFYTNIKRKLHQKLFLSIRYTNQTFSFTKLFPKPVPQVGETSIKSFPNSIHGLEVFFNLKNDFKILRIIHLASMCSEPLFGYNSEKSGTDAGFWFQSCTSYWNRLVASPSHFLRFCPNLNYSAACL